MGENFEWQIPIGLLGTNKWEACNDWIYGCHYQLWFIWVDSISNPLNKFGILFFKN